jgi:integrase
VASYRKLPSGKWQAIVKHPSGKRYTKTDTLKRVVVEWAEAKTTEMRRGDFVDPAAGKITLGDWWERWRATWRVQSATAAKRDSVWRTHIEPAFGSWPMDKIGSWDVEAWATALRGGPHAAASAVRLLKQVLHEATRHKLLRVDPSETIDVPSVPKHVDRILSIEEADALVEALTRPTGERKGVSRDQPYPREPDEAAQLFVLLMLEAGLRWEEAAGLHGFRVNLMRRQVRVQEVIERGRRVKAEPKSAAGQREVPLTDELVARLSRHMARRDLAGLLFTESDGRPLDYSNWLKRVWNPAVRRAELDEPRPTPHDCRHSYGSWLAEQGVPPHEIRDLMGHGSLRAVERYLHSTTTRMDRARGALDRRRLQDSGARRAHEAADRES